MEIIKAVLVHAIDNIEIFNIGVDETKALLVRERLELEHKKIIQHLKDLKEIGVIKSIFIPKNRKIQKELNNLVNAKKQIKNSVYKIKTIFYK